jgi:hypothetical protein
MSRSYLRDKWMRKNTTGQSYFPYTPKDKVRNKHRQDEMPKNKASKLVTMHCSADVDWLNHPGYCEGHRPRRGGHRRVSGLVRASLKEELRKRLKEELD